MNYVLKLTNNIISKVDKLEKNIEQNKLNTLQKIIKILDKKRTRKKSIIIHTIFFITIILIYTIFNLSLLYLLSKII